MDLLKIRLTDADTLELVAIDSQGVEHVKLSRELSLEGVSQVSETIDFQLGNLVRQLL